MLNSCEINIPITDIINKIPDKIIDFQTKAINNSRGKYDIHRALISCKNKIGYLCVKSHDYNSTYSSYSDLQYTINLLEDDISWHNSFEELCKYLEEHCTSNTYIEYVKKIKL